jgi:hypothetical protein
MSAIALIAIVAGSAISTITGIVYAAIKALITRRKTRSSGTANAKGRYTITVKRDGREVAYRIESSNPQAAEDAIRGIIEHPES